MLIHEDEKKLGSYVESTDVMGTMMWVSGSCNIYILIVFCVYVVSLTSSLKVKHIKLLIAKYKNSQTRVGIIFKTDNLETHSP